MNLYDLVQVVAGAVCAFFTGLVGIHVTHQFNPYLLLMFFVLIVVSTVLIRRGFHAFRDWG